MFKLVYLSVGRITMELKKHYKMYKSGKMWVSAAVATLALTAGMAVSTNVSADESTNDNQA